MRKTILTVVLSEVLTVFSLAAPGRVPQEHHPSNGLNVEGENAGAHEGR